MTRRTVEVPGDLPVLLDAWVAEGLITQEQAGRILSRPAPPPPTERRSLVTEALGYLGGVLILVATLLIAAQFWDRLPLGARLGLVAAAGAVLLAAGAALPARLGATGHRLRAVLWLLSAAAVGAFLGLLGTSSFHWAGNDVTLLIGLGTAGYAGALWWRHRSVLQHLAVFVTLALAAASAADHLGGGGDAPPGLAVWGVSLVWLVLGWGGLLTPRRAAYVLGGAGAMFGAHLVQTAPWTPALPLATAAALVVLAVLVGELALLAVGAVGALTALPPAVAEWFPGALAAPLAVLGIGVVLVAAAVYTARRRRQRARGAGSRLRDGSPRAALAVAAGTALAVTVVLLAIGLR